MLDRIDIKLEVPRVPHTDMREAPRGDDSATIRARVVRARACQLARAGKPNAWLGNTEVERDCALRANEQLLLDRAVEKLGLSARAYHRILRVARSIADLDESVQLSSAHLAEAIQYRRLQLH